MKTWLGSFALVLVLSCSAQERFTCVSTRDSSTGQSGVFNKRLDEVLRQGTRGKTGPVGPKGSQGQKGKQGKTGAIDRSIVKQLKSGNTDLTKRTKLLEQECSNLEETIKKGFKTLDNGWIGMFNGYKYKVTQVQKSYEDSKDICKGMGANLAVHGVQDIQSRKTLKRALNLVGDKWIGLNDKGVEGFWRWENGDYASDSTALWYPFCPDGGNRENCAYIWFDQTQLSNDMSCATRHYAICEKQWS